MSTGLAVGDYYTINAGSSFHLDPGAFSISVDYDNGGSVVSEIGGATCHLCGKAKVIENTYKIVNKLGKWTTRTYKLYKCQTEVTTNKKGEQKVNVGPKCLKGLTRE